MKNQNHAKMTVWKVLLAALLMGTTVAASYAQDDGSSSDAQALAAEAGAEAEPGWPPPVSMPPQSINHDSSIDAFSPAFTLADLEAERLPPLPNPCYPYAMDDDGNCSDVYDP